jgi:transcriptional regulator with XRE-family HTH domain
MSKPKSFAGILARLRKDAGLTLQALAEKSGLSKQVIHNYENGRRPTWDAVQALATALNLSTDHFRDRP